MKTAVIPERFEFDFRKLTKAQLRTLGAISVNDDHGQHHPKVIAKLIELGLIEEIPDKILPGRFPVHVKQYGMPIYAHIAWCEWCSKNLPEETE